MAHTFISKAIRVLRGTVVLTMLTATVLLMACAPPAPAPPPVVQAPATPTGLAIGYGVKSFKLRWAAVAAPIGGDVITYQLFEDTDGAWPIASTQIGGTLSGTHYTRVVGALLHTRLNARYQVQACNTVGCSSLSAAVTPNLTKAIGYLKGSNTEKFDTFGESVALSADGGTLAIGASRESSNATGINGLQSNNDVQNSGAVYVFTRSGGKWRQQAYIKASNTGAFDEFGTSISLSADGNTLAVGAWYEASSSTGINGGPAAQANDSAVRAGAVYVFARTISIVGRTWAQQAYVKASNARADDLFGHNVALSGDGSTLAVGAYWEASNHTGVTRGAPADANNLASESVAVYVFARTTNFLGSTWAQQAYVKASNTGVGDIFGYRVALSQDGNTLAVGAPGESSNPTGITSGAAAEANYASVYSGAVYVFVRRTGVIGTTWSQQALLKASNTGVGDGFGGSLALSGNGNMLAVGADQEGSSATVINGGAPAEANNAANGAGAVYLFSRTTYGTGSTLLQETYVKASNTGAGDRFGFNVALSVDGNTLAVAAPHEASNLAGIRAGAVAEANNLAVDSGAVYLFARNTHVIGRPWNQQAYVKAPNTATSDQFGWSAALSAEGKTLAVGATSEDSNATGINGDQSDNSAPDAGAVYLY